MLRVYGRLFGAGAYKESDSLFELLVSVVCWRGYVRR